MSFEALQERLAALQDTTSQVKELIDRLANLKFHPGSVPLTSGDGDDQEDNVATELSTEINQTLREQEEDLELLQEEITDLRSGRPGSDGEHNKARLRDATTRLGLELKSCRVTFRKAQLAARRSLDQARRLERDLLLASYAASAASTPLNNRSGASSPALGQSPSSQQPSQAASSNPQQQHAQELFPANYRRRRQQRQKQGGAVDAEAATVAASSDVTAALRRTQTLIAGEVAKSAFAAQTLAESTAALAGLRDRYSGLDGMLARSRDLLGALATSTKSDTWYLETAVYMLMATLGWLIFRRWLYGPLWLFVGLPVRGVWWVGKGLVRVGSGGPGKASMGIVGAGDGQKTVVEMQDDSAVPTISVGNSEDRKPPTEQADPDSMVEKVGRLVDGDGQQQPVEEQQQADNSSGDQPNTMKRMWEEEPTEAAAADAKPPRDEL